MATDEIFDLFHKYNRLVKRDLARPITCSNCGASLVTAFGAEDQLVLMCYVCNTQVEPGTRLLDRVRAVVSEYFL